MNCIKTDIRRSILNSVEYVPRKYKMANYDENERLFSEEGIDIEPVENFKWIEVLKKQDPEVLKSETYFTYINDSRAVMPKGS